MGTRRLELKLTNTKTGASGTLENWSLNITPVISVTPVNPLNGLASTFTVGFPQQELSGTYTIAIGANPALSIGNAFPQAQAGPRARPAMQVDSSLNAGLDVLRGGSSTSPVTTVQYAPADLPKVDPRAPWATTAGQVTSTIIVPDNFLVQGDTTSSGVSGLRVTLNLTFPATRP